MGVGLEEVGLEEVGLEEVEEGEGVITSIYSNKIFRELAVVNFLLFSLTLTLFHAKIDLSKWCFPLPSPSRQYFNISIFQRCACPLIKRLVNQY